MSSMVAQRGSQLHGKPVFEAAAVQIRIAIQRLGSSQRVSHACIKEVEFGCGNGLTLARLDPWRQHKSQQGVLERVIVFPDSRGWHLRIIANSNSIADYPNNQRLQS